MRKIYDVFICYKETTNGETTIDCKMAEELFTSLMQAGIKTFFSKISIIDSGETDYYKAILEALECCSVLVAVGTDKAHLESEWVQYEYQSFHKDMLSMKKRGHICSFIDQMEPCDLPMPLRGLEYFEKKNNSVSDVVSFIGKALERIRTDLKSRDPHDTVLLERERTVPISGGRNITNVYEQVMSNNCEDVAINSVIGDRYRVLKRIGQGGTSTVYLAHDALLNKEWAVKCYKKSNDTFINNNLYSTIISDAKLFMGLDHPSIPRIVDIIDEPEILSVIMEYVSGITLKKYIIEHGDQHEEDVIKWAIQLCDALKYLHDRKPSIIHRDIKPTNIMVNNDGMIKLVDFGAAREYGVGCLEDTTNLGTVGYAAPEQYGGLGQTDARTDIYSFGLTLYFLLTGVNPAEPPYEIYPIRQIKPSVSTAMEYIILKCIQPDRNKRFLTSGELLSSLININNIIIWKDNKLLEESLLNENGKINTAYTGSSYLDCGKNAEVRIVDIIFAANKSIKLGEKQVAFVFLTEKSMRNVVTETIESHLDTDCYVLNKGTYQLRMEEKIDIQLTSEDIEILSSDESFVWVGDYISSIFVIAAREACHNKKIHLHFTIHNKTERITDIHSVISLNDGN